jgi:Ca-activated chloride channel family protein
MTRFANPEFLGLLIIVPILIIWYLKRQRKTSGSVRFSNLGVVKSARKSAKTKLRYILFVLRIATIILIIIALSRPQSGETDEEVITEGIDIILSMDVSSSMLAEDFKPKNRLEAAKVVAKEFVEGRTNDRIGLVVFAGKSFTQCPLTIDYGILINFMEQIHIGMVEDGTAIGMAIANCINRLRDSKAKSKVVILLTDGVNNKGQLDPITAAKVAKTMGVRIYTIGAGKRGEALYPVEDPIFGKRYVHMPVEIDEESLQQIANTTGGKYFRATDRSSLERIYAEIGEMEKTKIEVKEFTRYSELFAPYLLFAILCFLFEVVLGNTIFRKLP